MLKQFHFHLPAWFYVMSSRCDVLRVTLPVTRNVPTARHLHTLEYKGSGGAL